MSWGTPNMKRTWSRLNEDEKVDVVFIFVGVFLVVSGICWSFGFSGFLICMGLLCLIAGLHKSET